MRKLLLYICLLLFISYPAYTQVRPSYHQGFVRHGSLSKRPNLWKGLASLWKPSLGVTGLGTDVIKDISSYKNHGTTEASMTMSDWVLSGNPKLPGYALDLDGGDDSVGIADSPSLTITGAITMSAWIKIPATQGGSFVHIIGAYATSSPFAGYGFVVRTDDRLAYWSGAHGSWAESNDAILSAGVWEHVVVRVSGTTATFYLNSIQQGTDTTEEPNAWSGTRAIGARSDGTQNLEAVIDDVRIYNRALSAIEILDIYQHPNAMFEPRDVILVKAPAVAAPRRIIMISKYNRMIRDSIKDTTSYLYN